MKTWQDTLTVTICDLFFKNGASGIAILENRCFSEHQEFHLSQKNIACR
jgi:hypothetical protein